MKLISMWCMIVTFGSYVFGGDSYKLIDIEECTLPISKKLEKRVEGSYTEKNYAGSLYVDPIGITFEKKNKEIVRINTKAKKMLHLDKKIIIAGFEVFTDNKKTI